MSRRLLRNVLIVFVLALAVRWTAAVVLHPHFGPNIIDGYDVMGQNILDGNGFSYRPDESIPTVTRAPFYPLWWATQLAVFGHDFLPIRMAEGFVDAITAALVVFMADALCRLSPGRAPPPAGESLSVMGKRQSIRIPTLAGAIYAFQPFTVYYAVKMGPEAWFTFWLVLLVWAFISLVLAPSYRGGVVVGVVAGILLLNKSTASGLLVVLAVLGVVWLRGRRATALVTLALCVLVAGLVVMPWMVRDYRVTGGHFVPMQTMTWWQFWADFDFSSRGWTNTIESHYAPGGGPAVFLPAPDEVRQEAHLRQQAMQWIAANPLGMASKMGRNLVKFWYLVEGPRRAMMSAVAMAVQLLAAIAGCLLAWRAGRHRLVALGLAVILYFNLVHTPIIAHVRYSLVVVPWLCLFQAFLIGWIYERTFRYAS